MAILIDDTLQARNGAPFPVVSGIIGVQASTLASFPQANAVPAGSLMVASDQGYGLYVSNGSTWVSGTSAGFAPQSANVVFAGPASGGLTAPGFRTLTVADTPPIGAVQLERFSGADLGARLAAAIATLPATGGSIDARGFTGAHIISSTITIDRPVTIHTSAQISCTATPAFNLTAGSGKAANFTLIGSDAKTCSITSASGGVIFNVTGDYFDFVGDGRAQIKISGVSLFGGGGASQAFVAQSFPTSNFQNGEILITDSLISGFGSTAGAVHIGASVYHVRLHRNYFESNQQALFIDNNAESTVSENWFIQGSGGGANFVYVGPMCLCDHNYFYRYSVGDSANSPDIQLQPQAAYGSQSGGYIWITHNRFGGERENFDSARHRIQLLSDAGADPSHLVIAGPIKILDNFVIGPTSGGTIAYTSGAATAQVTLSVNHTTATLSGRNVVIQSGPAGLNGVFPVASVLDTLNFTVTLPAPIAANLSGACSIGVLDQAPISLENPHQAVDIRGNHFLNYGVHVNDAQPDNTSLAWASCSVYKDNFAPQTSYPGYKIFKNGGKGFSVVQAPLDSDFVEQTVSPRQAETRFLQNRACSTEQLNLWTASNGLVCTTGQTDPYGTTRAALLTLSNTTPSSQSLRHSIDTSSLLASGRLVVKFWAKAGATSTLNCGIFDVTASAWKGNLQKFNLSTTWKQYKFVTNPLSGSDTYYMYFYPGDSSFVSGSCYVFAPQVSDIDCDYLPNSSTTTLVQDTTSGSRFDQSITVGRTLNLGAQASTPAAPASGNVQTYGVTTNGWTRMRTIDSNGLEVELGRDVMVQVRNVSGSTIPKGSVVYVSGATGNVPQVSLAQADYTMSKLPAAGIVAADIANNAYGQMYVRGLLTQYNTSGFTVGSTVYVSDVTPGALTTVAPSHPSVEQAVGTVVVSGVGNGAIQVAVQPLNLHRIDGTNRSSFAIGDAHTAGPMSYLMKQTAGTGTLQWTVTGNRTLTLPDTTDTLTINSSLPSVNAVLQYGCDPTGVADSTTALNNAITAASTSLSGQGIVYLPPGTYNFTGTINMKSIVRIVGSGLGKTVLQYTPATGTFVSFASCNSAGIEDLELRYTNALYNGALVTTASSSSLYFNRVTFRGLNAGNLTTAVALLDLTNSIEVRAHNCNFWGAQVGVRGINPGTGGYSNGQKLTTCVFNYCEVASVQNPELDWHIDNCVFEPTTLGKASGIVSSSASFTAQGLQVTGCYFSDASVAGNNWVDLYAQGVSFTGNYINNCASTTLPASLISSIVFESGSRGVSWKGNKVIGAENITVPAAPAVNAWSAATTGVEIDFGGNYLIGSSGAIVAPPVSQTGSTQANFLINAGTINVNNLSGFGTVTMSTSSTFTTQGRLAISGWYQSHRVTVADVDYTVNNNGQSGDYGVVYTSLTAPRTVTVNPTGGTVGNVRELYIDDASGAASATNPIKVVSTTGTINGVAQGTPVVAVSSPFGSARLRLDGTNTQLIQSNPAAGSGLSLSLLGGAPTYAVVGAKNGVVNVKDAAYGAKGDGITDDTTAINAAITAAAGSAEVYLPPGTYIVRNLAVNVANTKLVGSAASTLKLKVLASLDGSPIATVSASGCEFRSVIFDGQKASQPADGYSDSFNGGGNGTGRAYRAAIMANATLTGLIVDNCTFQNMYGACVATQNVSQIRITNCLAQSNNFELGFLSNTYVNGVQYTSDIVVGDNRVFNTGTGDATVNSNGLLIHQAQNVKVTGNLFDTVERDPLKAESCVGIVYANNTIQHVTLTGFSGGKFQGDCVDAVISGNKIYDAGEGFQINRTAGSAIGFSNITISGNTIDNIHGTQTPDGIQFSSAPGLPCVGITITGNTFSNVARYSIYLDFGTASAQDVVVSGNTITTTAVANSSIGVYCVADTNSSKNITISGNTIDMGNVASNGGVRFDASNGATFNNVVVVGNNVITGAGHTAYLALAGAVSSGKFAANYTDGVTNVAGFTLGDSSITGPLTISGNLVLSATGLTAARTFTFPDATDTVATIAAAQTLTNKTISGASNTLSNIGNGSLVNSSITLNTTAGAGVLGGGSVALGESLTFTVDQAFSPTWSGTHTFNNNITGPGHVAPAATALTLTGNAASTWSTSAGLLTLKGAAGITLDGNGGQTISLGKVSGDNVAFVGGVTGNIILTSGSNHTIQIQTAAVDTAGNQLNLLGGSGGAASVTGAGAGGETAVQGGGGGAGSATLRGAAGGLGFIGGGAGGNSAGAGSGSSGGVTIDAGQPGSNASGGPAGNAGTILIIGRNGAAGDATNAGGAGSAFTWTSGNGGVNNGGGGGTPGQITITAGNGAAANGASPATAGALFDAIGGAGGAGSASAAAGTGGGSQLAGGAGGASGGFSAGGNGGTVQLVGAAGGIGSGTAAGGNGSLLRLLGSTGGAAAPAGSGNGGTGSQIILTSGNGGAAGTGTGSGGSAGSISITGSTGGAASTTGAAGTGGGGIVITGGTGGAGATGQAPGVGAGISLVGGPAGADGGSGLNANGGSVTLNGGTATNSGTAGGINIGTARGAVTIGLNAGSLTIVSQVQTGIPLKVGNAIASASTIAPTAPITHITGTTTINTITAPTPFAQTGGGGQLTLIPDGLWTMGTSGNIALAVTAVVGKALIMTYDNATAKWYPSYTS